MYVDPLPLSAYPWYLRPWFWWQRRRTGAVVEPVRLWARRPRLLAPLMLLTAAFERRRAGLEPVLRAWVALRVGQINECPFTVDQSAHSLHRQGVAWEKIRAAADWADAEGFTSRERVVLGYIEAVTRSETPVSADVVGAVKRHLDDEALIELTGLAAFHNMTTKFNNALDVEPQGLCTLTVNDRGEAVAWEANPARGR